MIDILRKCHVLEKDLLNFYIYFDIIKDSYIIEGK
jgi:hypothetical protein